ncbi:MAG: hypothetical protein M1127_01690 [Patescibacteria group bacterium]|nr:hypothetical protein [Patescibacteria group bacterium]
MENQEKLKPNAEGYKESEGWTEQVLELKKTSFKNGLKKRSMTKQTRENTWKIWRNILMNTKNAGKKQGRKKNFTLPSF